MVKVNSLIGALLIVFSSCTVRAQPNPMHTTSNYYVNCPVTNLLIKKLETLVKNKPNSVDNENNYWNDGLYKLNFSSSLQSLLKESSNDQCENKASILLDNLSNQHSITKYSVYSALLEIYSSTNDNKEKLINLCEISDIQNSNKKDLKQACFFSLRDLADGYYSNKDYKRAFKLYNEVLAFGDNSGLVQSQIGFMYSSGLGTSQNSTAAIRWFQQALPLISDNVMQAYILNEMGANYMALSNYVMAFQYFLKSAKMGYSLSQLNLAILYANGYGTIQDNKEAYAWVSVALAQGFPGLPQKQVEAEQLKNNLTMGSWVVNGNFNELNSAKALSQEYYNEYVLHQGAPTINPLSKNISQAETAQPPDLLRRVKAAITAFEKN